MSKILPWRTLLSPSMARPLSAPSIALPCGSSTPDFRVTMTRAFIGSRTPCRSGRVRGRRHGQKRVERRRIAGGAQLGGDRGVAQQARARCERLEMVRAGCFRGDQHENEIDGQAVRGFEIDRTFEPGERAENVLAFGDLAMRDGDAVADPGRAEPLPLQKRVENLARRQA